MAQAAQTAVRPAVLVVRLHQASIRVVRGALASIRGAIPEPRLREHPVAALVAATKAVRITRAGLEGRASVLARFRLLAVTLWRSAYMVLADQVAIPSQAWLRRRAETVSEDLAAADPAAAIRQVVQAAMAASASA